MDEDSVTGGDDAEGTKPKLTLLKFPEESQANVSAKVALRWALEQADEFGEVLILARTRDGRDLTFSTTTDKGRMILMMESFKFNLIAGEFDEE